MKTSELTGAALDYALLIAAAPDLLSALQGLLAVVYDTERDDETVAAIKAAMDAITKATEK